MSRYVCKYHAVEGSFEVAHQDESRTAAFEVGHRPKQGHRLILFEMMQKQGTSDRVVGARQRPGQRVMLEEVERSVGFPGTAASILDRDGTYIAASDSPVEPHPCSSPPQTDRDVPCPRGNVEDAQAIRAQPLLEFDQRTEENGTAPADEIQPGKPCEGMSMPSGIEVRLVHDLGLAVSLSKPAHTSSVLHGENTMRSECEERSDETGTFSRRTGLDAAG